MQRLRRASRPAMLRSKAAPQAAAWLARTHGRPAGRPLLLPHPAGPWYCRRPCFCLAASVALGSLSSVPLLSPSRPSQICPQGFKEVFLTPDSLGIAMEFAAGGELFERIERARRFPEPVARWAGGRVAWGALRSSA